MFVEKILLLMLVSTYSDVSSLNTNDQGRTLLDDVLKATTDGLMFMWNRRNEVNLDAIIGTRIVEGQVGVLLNRLENTEFAVSPSLKSQLGSIRDLADNVSASATEFVGQSQKEYMNKLGGLLDRNFWNLNYPSRDLDFSLVLANRKRFEVMREPESDECVKELFEKPSLSEKCHISKHCWKRMTSLGYGLYSLSHEVFYLEIAIQTGCFSRDVGSNVDRLMEGFCANMLDEAYEIDALNFPMKKRDLLMEQVALCGMLGYRQFFRKDWLQFILQWQDKETGCWYITKKSQKYHRIKREEKELDDGCLSHKTTVALGALSQHVRYLVEDQLSLI